MPVKIQGMNKLTKELNALGRAFKGDKTKKAAKKPAEMLRDAVKSKTPVGPTGNLKRSIVAKELDYVYIVAVDQKIAPHAHLLENGTSKMSAQPFFRPNILKKAPAAADKFQNNLAVLVNKAVR